MPVLKRVAGVVLGIAGVVLLVYGVSVLVDYVDGERDAPIPFIVGGVSVLFLIPGAGFAYLGGCLALGRPTAIRRARGS